MVRASESGVLYSSYLKQAHEGSSRRKLQLTTMKTIESNSIDKGQLLQAGLDVDCIKRLFARLEDDVAANKYPGASIAMARHGQVVVSGKDVYKRQAQ